MAKQQQNQENLIRLRAATEIRKLRGLNLAKALEEKARVRRATSAVEAQAAALQVELDKGKPTAALNTAITNFPLDDPEGKGRALQAKMRSQFDLMRGNIDAKIEAQIGNMGFTEEQVKNLRKKAYETGRVHKLESKPGKAIYDPMIKEKNTQRLILESLESKGIMQRGQELVPRHRLLPRTPVPMPAPEALTAMAAEKGGIQGAVGKLAGRVGKAPLTGGAKLAGGAGLAMILLPLLSRILGGKKQEQQMPLPLQIQMAQMMAKMKQDEQLTQSLVSSRGASANKDMARAELLRLQAMMAGGGGAGVLV